MLNKSLQNNEQLTTILVRCDISHNIMDSLISLLATK